MVAHVNVGGMYVKGFVTFMNWKLSFIEMVTILDRWYTIADKYLLTFSSLDIVVVCRVCCACVCELFVYYCYYYYYLYFKYFYF